MITTSMLKTPQNILKQIGFIALIALFLNVFAAHASISGEGSVDSVSGYVTATNKNGEVRRLNKGDTLQDGDVINTGNESSITITLSNGDKVVLGALKSYTVISGNLNTGGLANSTLNGQAQASPLTGTTAGGVAPTTPDSGGSPINN